MNEASEREGKKINTNTNNLATRPNWNLLHRNSNNDDDNDDTQENNKKRCMNKRALQWTLSSLHHRSANDRHIYISFVPFDTYNCHFIFKWSNFGVLDGKRPHRSILSADI